VHQTQLVRLVGRIQTVVSPSSYHLQRSPSRLDLEELERILSAGIQDPLSFRLLPALCLFPLPLGFLLSGGLFGGGDRGPLSRDRLGLAPPSLCSPLPRRGFRLVLAPLAPI
jgi:hypothetical protein